MNSTKMPVIENIELMTARVPLPEGPWATRSTTLPILKWRLSMCTALTAKSGPGLAILPAGAENHLGADC